MHVVEQAFAFRREKETMPQEEGEVCCDRNGADQLNGGSGNSLMAGLNGKHASALGGMPMQESPVAGVSVPQAAQVGCFLFPVTQGQVVCRLLKNMGVLGQNCRDVVLVSIVSIDVRCVSSTLPAPWLLPWEANWIRQLLPYFQLV